MYKHKSDVELRPLRKDDLQALLELKLDSWIGTTNALFITLEDQLDWYERVRKSPNDLVMVIEKKENLYYQRIAVSLMNNINWISRSLNLSGHILSEYRGDNNLVKACYASTVDFCFEMLNMNRISTEPLMSNSVAQSLLQVYLGFEFEGRKRKSIFKCGKYYDSIVLGLLREDWEKQSRVKAYEGSCCRNWDLSITDQMIKETLGIINGKYNLNSDVLLQSAHSAQGSVK